MKDGSLHLASVVFLQLHHMIMNNNSLFYNSEQYRNIRKMQLGVVMIIIFVVLGIIFFIVFGTSYFKTEDSQNENLQNRSTVIFPNPASVPPECKYNPNDLLCQFQLEKQRMKLSQNE
jgi:hypothetical protein